MVVEDEPGIVPAISFNLKNNTFTFTFDILSSYLNAGTITIDNGKVVGITDDDKYTYVFEIVDSVVIPDFAYDRVGAVLYVNNKNQTSCVAFLDADGYYQSAGAYAKL
jgi:hypothetical protein